MNLNRVMLAGNLTRDPELKYTPSNKAVANVGLAVNNRFKLADGTLKEEVTFVDCEVWGATAEAMSKYLSKGRPVYIEGRLKLETWQDKGDGSNRSKMKVVVENFQFVDRKPEVGSDTGGQTKAAPAASPVKTALSGAPIEEDDIPF